MALLCTIFVCVIVQLLEASQQSTSLYFGTKTPYSYKPSTASMEYPSQCYPVHIEFVSRHGSRFPGTGDREDIDKLLKKLSRVYNKTSPFHYKNLTIPWVKWPEWSMADSRELSSRGELEQYQIAKRLRPNFPEVFDQQYWNKYYKFFARDKRRTSQSAMAFALGLFENDTGLLDFQPVAIKSAGPEEQDRLLSSYDACPRYSIDVEENGLGEYEKFTKGTEMMNAIKAIEKSLRIDGTLSLGFQEAEAIFALCAFGIMNHKDDSWCALLNNETVDVLNYANDMKDYYEHSFGNELSYKIICVLLGDIAKNLDEFSNGTSESRCEFRFASSGTLFSLLTILGVFDNGTALRADNFNQSSARKFPSNFVPMSSNVAIVLYKCNSTNGNSFDHKVQILVNEKPLGLPCCQGKITCSLEDFLNFFKDTVDNCDFESMCALPTGTTVAPKASGPITRPEIALLLVTLAGILEFFIY